MKKIFLAVLVMGAMVSCGKLAKKAVKAADKAATEVTAETTETPAADDDSFEGKLAKYETLYKELAELTKAVQSGDASAAAKAAELSQKLQSVQADLQSMMDKLTPEQQQKWKETMEKLTKWAAELQK